MAKGGKRVGAGRKPGVPNKITTDVRNAIVEAFELAGGVQYLQSLVATDPKAFCTLLGKTVPTMVGGDANNPLQLLSKVEVVFVHPKS